MKSLIIGDLHLSDTYTGRHKAYSSGCLSFLGKIYDLVLKHEIDVLILAGDIAGVKHETRFRTLEFRTEVLTYFNLFHSACSAVYFVNGNHDFSVREMSEVQSLVRLKFLRHVPDVVVGNTKFHFVDYGDESRILAKDMGSTNIVVAHNNFTVYGETDWYYAGRNTLELGSLQHWEGVDFVVSGHIHIPSPKIVSTKIGLSDTSLFYPGCGSRPEFMNDDLRYDYVWGVIVSDIESSQDVNISLEKIDLPSDIYSEVDISTSVKVTDDIKDYISDMAKYSYVVGDWHTRLDVIASGDADAYNLLLKYVAQVQSMDVGR